MRRFFALAILAFLFSCEINYDLAGGSENVESLPDIVMTSVEQLEVQGDQFFQVEAESAELYYDSGETRFKEIYFEELDLEGKVLRKGSAGELIQYDNDDLFLRGDIDLEDLDENSRILGEEFSWNEEERRLESSPDGKVTLQWDEDNLLEGRGFSADFRQNELSFSQSVQGELKGSE